ncbi:MAG TPA: hypothetical protein QF753_18605 [Victivallales bacterium]|nr:hypothetical protein [Victivallales bacterium]
MDNIYFYSKEKKAYLTKPVNDCFKLKKNIEIDGEIKKQYMVNTVAEDGTLFKKIISEKEYKNLNCRSESEYIF